MEFINSPAARAAKLPFSQAVRVGDILYLSGVLGNLPGRLELVPGGMEAETRQTMENIGTVLQENGLASPISSNVRSCWPTCRNGAISTGSILSTSLRTVCRHALRSVRTVLRWVHSSSSNAWPTCRHANQQNSLVTGNWPYEEPILTLEGNEGRFDSCLKESTVSAAAG